MDMDQPAVAMGSGADAAGADAAREEVRELVARSGTSFAMGMRVLPRERREAMYALYAFCREVDDIADEPGDVELRRRQLDEWRAEIGRLYEGSPTQAISRALVAPVAQYNLPREEFLAVIDGMETDLDNKMQAPPMQALREYCRQVAGAVGMISIRIFGVAEEDGPEIAERLGQALQLTNILRDLREDAQRGRLYLPGELLAAHGIKPGEPAKVLSHPNLPKVCDEIAAQARADFRKTRQLIKRGRRGPLKPCILMMEVYERILARLMKRGWRDLDREVHLSPAQKLWILVRYGLV